MAKHSIVYGTKGWGMSERIVKDAFPTIISGEFRVYSLTFEEPVYLELVVGNEIVKAKVEDRKLKEDILSGKARFGINTTIRGRLVKIENLGIYVLDRGEISKSSGGENHENL